MFGEGFNFDADWVTKEVFGILDSQKKSIIKKWKAYSENEVVGRPNWSAMESGCVKGDLIVQDEVGGAGILSLWGYKSDEKEDGD